MTAFGWAVWGIIYITVPLYTNYFDIIIFFVVVYSRDQISRRLLTSTKENFGSLPDWIVLFCHRLARRLPL